jgi:hypothetical protein
MQLPEVLRYICTDDMIFITIFKIKRTLYITSRSFTSDHMENILGVQPAPSVLQRCKCTFSV